MNLKCTRLDEAKGLFITLPLLSTQVWFVITNVACSPIHPLFAKPMIWRVAKCLLYCSKMWWWLTSYAVIPPFIWRWRGKRAVVTEIISFLSMAGSFSRAKGWYNTVSHNNTGEQWGWCYIYIFQLVCCLCILSVTNNACLRLGPMFGWREWHPLCQ